MKLPGNDIWRHSCVLRSSAGWVGSTRCNVYSLMTLWIFVSNYNGYIETRSNKWKCPGPDGESQSCLVWVNGNQFLSIYKLPSILEGEMWLYNLYTLFLAIYWSGHDQVIVRRISPLPGLNTSLALKQKAVDSNRDISMRISQRGMQLVERSLQLESDRTSYIMYFMINWNESFGTP